MKGFIPSNPIVAILLLLSVMLIPSKSPAQTITATINGTVTDPNGAVVPGATVTATAAETGLSKTATTDDEGRYTITFLQPGAYSVAVDASGFGRAIRPDVRLEVAQTATLDFGLTVGAAQEVIEVTDTTTQLLITENSGLENTVENKLIEELPSAERSTLSFINLLPGTIDGGFAGAAGESLNVNGNAAGPIGSPGNRNFFDSNFSVSGGQTSTNEVLLDGVANTVADFNGVAISPPQDSVREFKVLSGAYSAEYGRSGGGVVNFITRAGTKDFHGALYEYFQNGGLNANGWQRNRRGRNANGSAVLPRIPIKRNQFGGTVGGPVVLPRFGEGGPAFAKSASTFFFFNYEGRREKNPFSKELTLPTARMRTGDLSELLTGATRADASNPDRVINPDGSRALFGQIYNPFGALANGKRQPIPGNRLDLLPQCGAGTRAAACLDPVALNVLSYLPLPNQPGLVNNYVFSDTAEFTRDIFATRIDTTISERQSLFGRFSYEKRLQAEPNYFFNSPAANVRRIRDQFGNFTLNHVFSVTDSVINNLRYGYTRVRANQIPNSQDFSPTLLGFPSYTADTAPILAFPFFTFSGGVEGQGVAGEITQGDQIGAAGNNQPRDTHTVADAVTLVRGNQTIRAGGEYRLYRFFAFQFNNPAGRYSFNRTFTRGPFPNLTPANAAETGSSLASFLLGLPAGGSRESVTPLTLYHHYAAAFVQDDYKIARDLTLNLGLRWDIETGTAETHQLATTFDLDAPSQLSGRVPAPTDAAVRALRPNFTDLRGLLSFPDGPQSRANRNRFAPRVGFAYRVNDKTTLRGGYGIFYVPLSLEQTTALGNVFNTNLAQVVAGTTGQVLPGNPATSTVFLTNPFPNGIPLPPGNALGANTLIGQSPFVVEPNRRTSYVQQYNFVFQRELARNLVLDVAYAGSHGVRLPIRQVNLNQIPPEYVDYARSVVGNNPTALNNFFNELVPNPFFGVITNPTAEANLRLPTVARQQLLKRFPQYNAVNLFNPLLAASKYNSLQINVQKRFSDGLSGTANYTFSKLMDIGQPGNNSGFLPGVGTSIENVFDLAGEFAVSNFDVPHRFAASFVYELPFGRGRRFGGRVNGFVNALLGNFQVSGSATYQSGSPIPIIGAGAFLGSSVRRPNRVPGTDASIDGDEARANVRDGGVWFDTSVFSQPADFTFGNAARNYSDVRRDTYKNVNLSVTKNFLFNEGRQRLQFRGEFLNAFNIVVFGTPGRDVNNPSTFGLVTTQGNTPRVIQFVLRYTY